MKTSGHLILYISENEDFELWKILTQISPEERTAFVKNALKRALAHNNSTNPNHSSTNYHGTEKSKPSPPVNFEEFSHQEAATRELIEEDTNQLQLDELILSSSSEFTDNSSIPGLDFLLNNVIGEEDDEMVIEFIKNNRQT